MDHTFPKCVKWGTTSCGTIMCIHMSIYIYIYIYRCMCVGLCVCSWIYDWRNVFIVSMFGRRQNVWKIFLYLSILAQRPHKDQWLRVPAWRSKTRGIVGKDQGRWSVKSKTRSLEVRERDTIRERSRAVRENDHVGKERRAVSVKAIVKQRPRSDLRDESTVLIAVCGLFQIATPGIQTLIADSIFNDHNHFS